MSFLQKVFVHILPQKWADSMEAESRSWMFRCPCGFERSWWDFGAIRWKAAGNPRRMMRCPKCGQVTWHTTYKKEAPEAHQHVA
jgi:hypothetical protein